DTMSGSLDLDLAADGGAAKRADPAASGEAGDDSIAGTQIDHPRAIVSRRRLSARLEQIFRDIPPGPQHRAAVLAAMKEALAAGRAEVRRRFEEEAASGTQTVRA